MGHEIIALFGVDPDGDEGLAAPELEDLAGGPEAGSGRLAEEVDRQVAGHREELRADLRDDGDIGDGVGKVISVGPEIVPPGRS